MVHTCPTCGHDIHDRNIRVDLDDNLLVIDGKIIQLRPKEAELAYALLESRRGMKKWDIMQALYGYKWDEVYQNAPEVWISYLRRKLEGTSWEIPRYRHVYRITPRKELEHARL